MRKICSPLAFLLIISSPLSAEEVPANSLPSLPPVSSNTLDAMPSVDIPDIVPASPPLQVELPPVDASVLKAANPQATSVAPQQLKVTPGINELIPIAVGHLNRLVTPFDNPVVTTTSQATTSTHGKIVYVATADETPVTLYITPGDNQDIALSLTLIPKRIPAREIHLSLDIHQFGHWLHITTISLQDFTITPGQGICSSAALARSAMYWMVWVS